MKFFCSVTPDAVVVFQQKSNISLSFEMLTIRRIRALKQDAQNKMENTNEMLFLW